MSEDNDKIGLVFRYLDPDNFYVLSWGKEREELLFTKVVDGKTTEILRKKLAYEEETWYQLQVDVVGNEMSAYIDKPLKGDLRGWRSYPLSQKGNSYRLAYKVDEEKKQVIFGSVATRQGFYDDLRKS
ncbi:type II toxin-antitoxin system RelE/ParE family toxin [Candidatus Bipolaricaulota bacterium]|nr:type II toxin-antitoxin system RelE/ParE family toxin [Candidatus Bipolaricaulota bacterium]